MGEEGLDARESQGLIKGDNPRVKQQFGDRQTANTDGGDYAGRNIDKRTIINLIVPNGDPEQISGNQSLQNLLNQLSQSGSQDSVEQAYQAALPPDAELFRSEVTDNFDILSQLQEFNRLRDFVAYLIDDNSVPEALRLKLKDELDSYDSASKSDKAPFSDLITKQVSKKLSPYLMVVLQPTSQDGQFLINAWLLSDDAEPNSLDRFQPLDLEESQKGTACDVSEVSGKIDQFLKRSRQYLRGRLCCPITLEIFLPLEYLCSEVEQWEISIRRNRMLPIGIQHPVIVRSYERLDLEYLDYCWTEWCENWEQFKRYWNVAPSHELFEKLEEVENCDWDSILYNYRAKVEKIGFIIPCLPSEEKQEALFNAMLDASVPIALWVRKALPEFDHITEFTELLQTGLLKDLPECIRKLRERAHIQRKAVDIDYAYHLSILWEDPNRLPPNVMIQLQSPG
jgi:hypothetical protein